MALALTWIMPISYFKFSSDFIWRQNLKELALVWQSPNELFTNMAARYGLNQLKAMVLHFISAFPCSTSMVKINHLKTSRILLALTQTMGNMENSLIEILLIEDSQLDAEMTIRALKKNNIAN